MCFPLVVLERVTPQQHLPRDKMRRAARAVGHPEDDEDGYLHGTLMHDMLKRYPPGRPSSAWQRRHSRCRSSVLQVTRSSSSSASSQRVIPTAHYGVIFLPMVRNKFITMGEEAVARSHQTAPLFFLGTTTLQGMKCECSRSCGDKS